MEQKVSNLSINKHFASKHTSYYVKKNLYRIDVQKGEKMFYLLTIFCMPKQTSLFHKRDFFKIIVTNAPIFRHCIV